MKKIMFFVILATVVLAHAGAAQSCDRGSGHHRQDVRGRIEKGWHSGELTRDELRLLKMEGKQIARARKRMLRDGYLDPHERRKLHRMHRDFDRELWRQKHDRDHRRR
ncbi:MAG: hypothetical protein IT266_00320 [Saprospiraceae bacterium]|nr:hypothetical protein [Saprospiraceae bacterium]